MNTIDKDREEAGKTAEYIYGQWMREWPDDDRFKRKELEKENICMVTKCIQDQCSRIRKEAAEEAARKERERLIMIVRKLGYSHTEDEPYHIAFNDALVYAVQEMQGPNLLHPDDHILTPESASKENYGDDMAISIPVVRYARFKIGKTTPLEPPTDLIPRAECPTNESASEKEE